MGNRFYLHEVSLEGEIIWLGKAQSSADAISRAERKSGVRMGRAHVRIVPQEKK